MILFGKESVEGNHIEPILNQLPKHVVKSIADGRAEFTDHFGPVLI